jgi:hypothetical protein
MNQALTSSASSSRPSASSARARSKRMGGMDWGSMRSTATSASASSYLREIRYNAAVTAVAVLRHLMFETWDGGSVRSSATSASASSYLGKIRYNAAFAHTHSQRSQLGTDLGSMCSRPPPPPALPHTLQHCQVTACHYRRGAERAHAHAAGSNDSRTPAARTAWRRALVASATVSRMQQQRSVLYDNKSCSILQV